MVAMALIAAASLAHRGRGKMLAMSFGLSLVLLPLCGGSGITMLPPLAAWLAGHLAVGWWSGQRPARPTRVIGEAILLASVALAAFYLLGYKRPPGFPPPPSIGAVASSSLKYLSLALYPHISSYRWPAGPILVAFVAATLGLLLIASCRAPDERPRALGLMAIILSMLCVALAVGVSRSGFGPDTALASRYVTLTIPLLCAVYVSWLVYAKGLARSAIHLSLIGLMGLAFPDGEQSSRIHGSHMREIEVGIEQDLRGHLPTAVLMSRACQVLQIDPKAAYRWFKMLKAARVGAFTEFEEERFASAPDDGTGPVRR
jgi:hypothetical protein